MTFYDSLRVGTAAIVCLALSGCSVASGGGASASCSPAPSPSPASASPLLYLASPVVGSSVPSSTTRIYVDIEPNTYAPASSSVTLSGGDGTQIIGGPLVAISSAPSPAATPGNAQPFSLYESDVSGLEAAQSYRVSVTVSLAPNLNAPCSGAFAEDLGSFQTN